MIDTSWRHAFIMADWILWHALIALPIGWGIQAGTERKARRNASTRHQAGSVQRGTCRSAHRERRAQVPLVRCACSLFEQAHGR